MTVRNLADVVDTDVPGGRLITATVASAGDYRLSVRRVDVASPKGVAPLRPSFTGRPPTSSPPRPPPITIGSRAFPEITRFRGDDSPR